MIWNVILYNVSYINETFVVLKVQLLKGVLNIFSILTWNFCVGVMEQVSFFVRKWYLAHSWSLPCCHIVHLCVVTDLRVWQRVKFRMCVINASVTHKAIFWKTCFHTCQVVWFGRILCGEEPFSAMCVVHSQFVQRTADFHSTPLFVILHSFHTTILNSIQIEVTVFSNCRKYSTRSCFNR